MIANRFDATEGTLAGHDRQCHHQVGDEHLRRNVRRLFQDDKFNAKDFIKNRVLPYSNQQLSTTFGGPIRRDRMHFFGAYEYRARAKDLHLHESVSRVQHRPGVPDEGHKALGRLDYQFTPQTRLSARVSYFNNDFYAGGGATSHPSASG